MNLYEYQAKKIFKENDIPVPHGIVCTNEKELQAAFIAVEKGSEAVLKAQVLTGGRGKSGGIRIVSTPEQASETFCEMMNMTMLMPRWMAKAPKRFMTSLLSAEARSGSAAQTVSMRMERSRGCTDLVSAPTEM